MDPIYCDKDLFFTIALPYQLLIHFTTLIIEKVERVNIRFLQGPRKSVSSNLTQVLEMSVSSNSTQVLEMAL